MTHESADTIFAMAAGGGRSAITVVRISGPATNTIISGLTGGVPQPRVASLRMLRDQAREPLDRTIVLRFPGPHSYTGEDSCELHLHGGSAVLAAVTTELAALGARPAGAGEFTRRAFLNGKLGLLEAEAVADLVDAETDGQRRQALRQMQGGLTEIYQAWSKRLLSIVARQEALIDFPDEAEPDDLAGTIYSDVEALRYEIMAHLSDARRGERVRDGIVFVIAGPPNAGKSSLINALAGRDVALVAADPGTTRDAVEARIRLAGVPVTLTDTAGLRVTADDVEQAGVERAKARIREADCVIALGVATGPPPAIAIDLTNKTTPCLIVASKIDLAPAPAWAGLAVSVLTGEGLEALRQALERVASEMTAAAEAPPLTRLRHRKALEATAAALASASEADMAELCGEDLRAALFAIGGLLGHANVEDVLDAIFREFCIGK